VSPVSNCFFVCGLCTNKRAVRMCVRDNPVNPQTTAQMMGNIKPAAVAAVQQHSGRLGDLPGSDAGSVEGGKAESGQDVVFVYVGQRFGDDDLLVSALKRPSASFAYTPTELLELPRAAYYQCAPQWCPTCMHEYLWHDAVAAGMMCNAASCGAVSNHTVLPCLTDPRTSASLLEPVETGGGKPASCRDLWRRDSCIRLSRSTGHKWRGPRWLVKRGRTVFRCCTPQLTDCPGHSPVLCEHVNLTGVQGHMQQCRVDSQRAGSFTSSPARPTWPVQAGTDTVPRTRAADCLSSGTALRWPHAPFLSHPA
jgi:hypothetical protein